MPSRINQPAEQILEERRERSRVYMQKYRAEHPDYNRRSRVRSAELLLIREGYQVFAPDGSVCK